MKAYTGGYKAIAAREKCKADGAHLPTPKSEAENHWFDNYRAKVNIRDFWLGIDDIKVEGEWKTENGDLQTYFNWANNQPDNWKNSVKGSR